LGEESCICNQQFKPDDSLPPALSFHPAGKGGQLITVSGQGKEIDRCLCATIA
jgi:hypothetical protein